MDAEPTISIDLNALRYLLSNWGFAVLWTLSAGTRIFPQPGILRRVCYAIKKDSFIIHTEKCYWPVAIKIVGVFYWFGDRYNFCSAKAFGMLCLRKHNPKNCVSHCGASGPRCPRSSGKTCCKPGCLLHFVSLRDLVTS